MEGIVLGGRGARGISIDFWSWERARGGEGQDRGVTGTAMTDNFLGAGDGASVDIVASGSGTEDDGSATNSDSERGLAGGDGSGEAGVVVVCVAIASGVVVAITAVSMMSGVIVTVSVVGGSITEALTGDGGGDGRNRLEIGCSGDEGSDRGLGTLGVVAGEAVGDL